MTFQDVLIVAAIAALAGLFIYLGTPRSGPSDATSDAPSRDETSAETRARRALARHRAVKRADIHASGAPRRAPSAPTPGAAPAPAATTPLDHSPVTGGDCGGGGAC